MNTVNIVLMIILSAMIGFAIGNAWGKESMKRMMTDLLNQMIQGAKSAVGQTSSRDESGNRDN